MTPRAGSRADSGPEGGTDDAASWSGRSVKHCSFFRRHGASAALDVREYDVGTVARGFLHGDLVDIGAAVQPDVADRLGKPRITRLEVDVPVAVLECAIQVE